MDSTAVDLESAAIDALSKRMDAMLQRMQAALARMNSIRLDASATRSSASSPPASPVFSTPTAESMSSPMSSPTVPPPTYSSSMGASSSSAAVVPTRPSTSSMGVHKVFDKMVPQQDVLIGGALGTMEANNITRASTPGSFMATRNITEEEDYMLRNFLRVRDHRIQKVPVKQLQYRKRKPRVSSTPTTAPTAPAAAAPTSTPEPMVPGAEDELLTTTPPKCSTQGHTPFNNMKNSSTGRYTTTSTPPIFSGIVLSDTATGGLEAHTVLEQLATMLSFSICSAFSDAQICVLMRQPWPPPMPFEFRGRIFRLECAAANCVFDPGKNKMSELTITITMPVMHFDSAASGKNNMGELTIAGKSSATSEDVLWVCDEMPSRLELYVTVAQVDRRMASNLPQHIWHDILVPSAYDFHVTGMATSLLQIQYGVCILVLVLCRQLLGYWRCWKYSCFLEIQVEEKGIVAFSIGLHVILLATDIGHLIFEGESLLCNSWQIFPCEILGDNVLSGEVLAKGWMADSAYGLNLVGNSPLSMSVNCCCSSTFTVQFSAETSLVTSTQLLVDRKSDHTTSVKCSDQCRQHFFNNVAEIEPAPMFWLSGTIDPVKLQSFYGDHSMFDGGKCMVIVTFLSTISKGNHGQVSKLPKPPWLSQVRVGILMESSPCCNTSEYALEELLLNGMQCSCMKLVEDVLQVTKKICIAAWEFSTSPLRNVPELHLDINIMSYPSSVDHVILGYYMEQRMFDMENGRSALESFKLYRLCDTWLGWCTSVLWRVGFHNHDWQYANLWKESAKIFHLGAYFWRGCLTFFSDSILLVACSEPSGDPFKSIMIGYYNTNSQVKYSDIWTSTVENQHVLWSRHWRYDSTHAMAMIGIQRFQFLSLQQLKRLSIKNIPWDPGYYDSGLRASHISSGGECHGPGNHVSPMGRETKAVVFSIQKEQGMEHKGIDEQNQNQGCGLFFLL